MHLRPGRAAVVQGPAWQETTQRSRGEGRPPWGPGGESGSPSARCWSPASLSWASCASPWCSAAWCRWPSGGSTTPPRAGTRGQSQHWSSFTLALQVEDAMLDTYDLVYDEAVRSPSSIQGPKLAAIQDTFLCCGKRSPFQLLGSREADPCRGEEAAREDCLQSVRSFLKTPQNIASMLTSTGLALMVYAMLLSSFLCFAVRSGRGLDRRGKYTLPPRACSCQAQEPSHFTLSQGGPVPRRSSEAEALAGHRGPRGCLHDPHLLQS
ncbi:tetraspanin-32 isoform X4 [Marmota monax]|uniref:tetraspanin-32 isoform X4 n=1 Tax=Marmota monax TaxID=9995 RepID=UPI0026F03ECD|nr:tetraspanin-32 isoform X4 [Marmota monax]